jgi:hypothetical protein
MAVRHIVLLKFKQDTPTDQIREVFDALAGLSAVIPGITDFIAGPYSSPEGLNQGYAHGFIMTFADAAARNVYLDHPEHEKVKARGAPILDSVLAFDLEVPDR